jgi:polyhydroxybutyrate depolymerase
VVARADRGEKNRMVIRNLCWSLGLLAAVCSGCSSDSGAGNGFIDLPPAPRSNITSGNGDGAGGYSSGGGGLSGSTSIAGTSSVSPDAGGMSGVDAVLPSAGCGKALPMGQTLGAYIEYTVHVTGATLDPNFSYPAHDRGYYVWLPKDYNSSKPYRTTFIGYGCGNKYAGNTATYKLMLQDPESIYIGMNMPPDNIATQEGACYNDSGGLQSTEWEFFGLMGDQVEQNFCVDQNRVFVAGYSSGSWLANMLGCYYAGPNPARKFGPDLSVRGQSTVSGGPVPSTVPCGGNVAGMWIHDTNDPANDYGGSVMARDRVLTQNGCVGSAMKAWGSIDLLSSVCMQYTACPVDYPVVFCTTMGLQHGAQDNRALPGFIEFQEMMNAK